MAVLPPLARPDALLLVIGFALVPVVAGFTMAVTPLRYVAYAGTAVATAATADGLFRNPPTN
jgi:hypothetical protein